MKELLNESGSIYVHIDWHVGHYMKVILDDIFGKENLINEIVWHYKRWTAASDTFQKMHDVIFWYGKGETHVYNRQYQPFSEKTKNIAKNQSATHMKRQDFPGGPMVENLPANVGNTDLIWEYST